VSGVGIVVSGTVKAGILQPNDHMFLGPFADGTFLPVQVLLLSFPPKKYHILLVFALICTVETITFYWVLVQFVH
jgi:GTPase